MDRAVKRGFAIGFVVVAAMVAAVYGYREAMAPTLAAARRAFVSIPVDLAPAQAPSRAAASAPSEAAVAPGSRPDAAPKPPSVAALAPAAPDAARLTPSRARGTFDVVRVEPSGEMVVAGRCLGGCVAQLLANGAPHAAAAADPQGYWAMAPAPLAPGDYQIGLKVRNPDGREAMSEQTLTVSIPAPPSRDVIVVLNEPDAPSRILQTPEPKVAAAPSAAAGPVVSAFAPAAASPSGDAREAQLSVAAIEAESGRFFAQGVGPAGAKLRFYLNNAPIAEATVGPDGRWSLRVERGVAPGAYAVRVDRLDAGSGAVMARAEARFAYAAPVAVVRAAPRTSDGLLSTAAPSASRPGAASVASPDPSAADAANPVVAAIDTATVTRGDSLWRISRAIYGRGVRYTVIFQANDGQIRNPNLIYPGQVFVLPSRSAEAALDSAPR